MKFRLLVDNKTEDSRCHAEWGLSILIETRGKQILLDTGASPMFAENAKRLGVDLSQADALVISHGHYDHTEGVPAFTACNTKAPIYLHKDALYETYGKTDGLIDEEPCGILWSQDYLQSVKDRLVLTEGLFPLFDNVFIAGDIPDDEDFQATESFYRKAPANGADTDTAWVKDPMNHEQLLVIEEQERLYVFSGCSHKGVVSAVRYVNHLFPGKKIAAFIGGMHLIPVSEEVREKIIREIISMEIEQIFPLHCTGMEGILQLRGKLGERCVLASAGDVYEY